MQQHQGRPRALDIATADIPFTVQDGKIELRVVDSSGVETVVWQGRAGQWGRSPHRLALIRTKDYNQTKE